MNQIRGLCPIVFCVLFSILSAKLLAHHSFRSGPIERSASIVCLSGDEEIVKGLFTSRTQMDPAMAYETSFFKDLVARQKSDNQKLKYQDDIKKLNEELSRLEVEKANGENPKLVEKEAKLKQEKAHYEIQDAAVLSYYTQSEYDQLTVRVSEVYATNKTRIESREMIFNEIQFLFDQSEEHMKKAAETMAGSYAIKDEIERAKNGRLSFAMEALGIEQMNQILEIIAQLEMLLSYTNEQLVDMKGGQSSGEGRGTVTVLEKTEEKIDVTISEPIADIVKVQTPIEEETSSEIKTASPVVPAPTEKPEIMLTSTPPTERQLVKSESQIAQKKNTGAPSKKARGCMSISETEGTFYTIQVGSFNEKLPSVDAFNKLDDLYLDDGDGIHFRYSTGQFTNMEEAFEFAQSLHKKGYPDAFVTAISDGQRITIQSAKTLLGGTTR